MKSKLLVRVLPVAILLLSIPTGIANAATPTSQPTLSSNQVGIQTSKSTKTSKEKVLQKTKAKTKQTITKSPSPKSTSLYPRMHGDVVPPSGYQRAKGYVGGVDIPVGLYRYEPGADCSFFIETLNNERIGGLNILELRKGEHLWNPECPVRFGPPTFKEGLLLPDSSHLVGADIFPGIYHAENNLSCMFALVSQEELTRDNFAVGFGNLNNVRDILIPADAEGVYFGRDCGKITKIGDSDAAAKAAPPGKILQDKGSGKICNVDSACPIGSTGPGGGIVFFDAGSQQSWGRYLEFAPGGWFGSKIDPETTWCSILEPSEVAKLGARLSNEIGEGKANTKAIMSSCKTSGAELAHSFVGEGKQDWFLPSKNELNELCKYANGQLTGDSKVMCAGDSSGTFQWRNFKIKSYMSSSLGGQEFPDVVPFWDQSFHSGIQLILHGSINGVTNGGTVHPIRAF